MATNKQTAKSTKTYLRDVIHKCGSTMYVVPRQEYTFDGNVDAYIVRFKSSDYRMIPDDIMETNHKYCPHCGMLLYVEEGELNA